MESFERLRKKLELLKTNREIYGLTDKDLELIDLVIQDLENLKKKQQPLSEAELARILLMILKILLESSG